jgi:hypothetical protein
MSTSSSSSQRGEDKASGKGKDADTFHYTLYIANTRIYARNADNKLIDLGQATEQAGSFSWMLDGDESLRGRHLPNADAVMRKLEKKMSFVFLDGQFTSLPDLIHNGEVRVADAPRRAITLRRSD